LGIVGTETAFPLAFVLHSAAGLAFFNGCQRLVDRFISFADEGNRLVFGPLAKPDVLGNAFGPEHTFLFVIRSSGNGSSSTNSSATSV
jgi:nucleoside permease NupC